MSEENVEIVRRLWEAWERRDEEALFALCDPAIVWDQSHAGPVELHDVYHGNEGVRQLFREWLEPFENYYAHAETFIDVGDNVVVGYRTGGRGKASGAEVEMPFWQVYRIRNSLVIRIEDFGTKARALEAARLQE